MIGLLLGGLAGFALVSTAWTGELFEDPASSFYVAAVVILVGGLLVGSIFTRTIGIALVSWSFAAVLAAVVVMFHGQWAYVMPLLLNAGASIVVQNILVRRVRVEYVG